MMPLPSHPILSPAQTRVLEEQRFGADESRAWPAMRSAGRALARAIRQDAAEMGGLDPAGRWLVVAGKGHEQGQTLAGVVHPFDDVSETRAALEGRS